MSLYIRINKFTSQHSTLFITVSSTPYSGYPLTHALEGFFFLSKNWVFVDVNQLFPWYSTHSDRFPHRWTTETYKIKWWQLFKLLFIRWRITLLKQVLCELSEVAKTFSKVYVTVSQVDYLFDCMKTREPWMNCQEANINSRNERYHTEKGKSFLWMEAVLENEFYFLSFFMLSNRI